MNLKLAEYPIRKKQWMHTCIDATTMQAINTVAKDLGMPKMYIINAALGQMLTEGIMKKGKSYGTKKAGTKKTTKTSKKK